MAFNLPIPPGLDDPLLGFRFGVFFLGNIGISHPLDFRFQSVSGLSVQVQTTKKSGEGNDVTGLILPDSLSYPNLVLKRGMPVVSTLSMEIHRSLNQFRFKLRNVLLSILDENGLPLNSYLFSEVYPVKWSLSTLDATSNSVIVEEMELSYRSFKPFML